MHFKPDNLFKYVLFQAGSLISFVLDLFNAEFQFKHGKAEFQILKFQIC